MGTANDFMNSFFAAYPHAKSGELSMEELNRLLGEYQRKKNSSPLDDFDGLSPEQMNPLLYAPFTAEAILQFRKDIDAYVSKVPFFKLSELLLHEIKKTVHLKLTVNGSLPVRICELLCSQNLIHWPYMKFVKRIRAYSLVLLSKYGNKPQKSEFYSLKLMRAFEKELWEAHQQGKADKALQTYHYAYETRFFECFADWFGLINIERKRDHSISYIDQLSITKSELFDQLFELKNKK